MSLILTAYSPIISTVNLLGPSAGGDYHITASTAHGKIDLNVPTAPVNATIDISATSSLAPVAVHLPDTFEGTYSLETTLGHASLIVEDDVKDPEKRGRKKLYNGEKEGFLEWSDESGEGTGEGRERGTVSLKTVLGPVKLFW